MSFPIGRGHVGFRTRASLVVTPGIFPNISFRDQGFVEFNAAPKMDFVSAFATFVGVNTNLAYRNPYLGFLQW